MVAVKERARDSLGRSTRVGQLAERAGVPRLLSADGGTTAAVGVDHYADHALRLVDGRLALRLLRKSVATDGPAVEATVLVRTDHLTASPHLETMQIVEIAATVVDAV